VKRGRRKKKGGGRDIRKKRPNLSRKRCKNRREMEDPDLVSEEETYWKETQKREQEKRREECGGVTRGRKKKRET